MFYCCLIVRASFLPYHGENVFTLLLTTIYYDVYWLAAWLSG